MFIQPLPLFAIFHFPVPGKSLAGIAAKSQLEKKKSTVYELGDKNNKRLRQACFCNKKDHFQQKEEEYGRRCRVPEVAE